MLKLCIAAFVTATLSLPGSMYAQPRTDAVLQSILTAHADPAFKSIVSEPQVYRCQVIYTRINRDKTNQPNFKNYYYNYDPSLYFNPASMVKMPLAFLALEKLNALKIKGVTKYSAIQYDSSRAKQTTAYQDSTSANGLPSIAHYIKRAFLISENDPYNRLYQFVGATGY